jgi:Uma2 family endonuclease
MVIGPVIYPPQPITFEQYMAEEPVKRRYDIVNGVRVFSVPPSLRHQDILGNILSAFNDYGRQAGYATLFSLFDVLISWEPFCTRQPDVMLVSKAGLQSHKDGEPLSFAPELVVEILSSTERELALDTKLRDYTAIGVQECWIVRPEESAITTLRPTYSGWEQAAVYKADEILIASILPKLHVPVNDIFTIG